VKALCSQEVVVYYNVDEIIFYDSAELKTVRETFSGWRIAFVVNVIEEHIDSDVKILKLDFASECNLCVGDMDADHLSDAQFCRHLSFFSSTNVDVKTYIQEFIEFMTVDYIDLVVESVHTKFALLPVVLMPISDTNSLSFGAAILTSVPRPTDQPVPRRTNPSTSMILPGR
jgi:hypothetical protein